MVLETCQPGFASTNRANPRPNRAELPRSKWLDRLPSAPERVMRTVR